MGVAGHHVNGFEFGRGNVKALSWHRTGTRSSRQNGEVKNQESKTPETRAGLEQPQGQQTSAATLSTSSSRRGDKVGPSGTGKGHAEGEMAEHGPHWREGGG